MFFKKAVSEKKERTAFSSSESFISHKVAVQRSANAGNVAIFAFIILLRKVVFPAFSSPATAIFMVPDSQRCFMSATLRFSDSNLFIKKSIFRVATSGSIDSNAPFKEHRQSCS